MVIDGHSHIGDDFYHGQADIDGDIKFATETGINVGLLMLVPSPCMLVDGVNKPVVSWFKDGEYIKFDARENPFYELNYKLYNQILKKSTESLSSTRIPYDINTLH